MKHEPSAKVDVAVRVRHLSLRERGLATPKRKRNHVRILVSPRVGEQPARKVAEELKDRVVENPSDRNAVRSAPIVRSPDQEGGPVSELRNGCRRIPLARRTAAFQGL